MPSVFLPVQGADTELPGGKVPGSHGRRVRALACRRLFLSLSGRSLMCRDCAIRTAAPVVSHRVYIARHLDRSSAVGARRRPVVRRAGAGAGIRIIHPGSTAVTGFSGTFIPDIEEACRQASIRSTKPSSTPDARRCASSTFQLLAGHRPANSSTRRRHSRCWPARSARYSL